MSDDFFGDVVYEVWRRGGNPDAVDRDEVADCQYEGYWPEECAESFLRNERAARERRKEARDE